MSRDQVRDLPRSACPSAPHRGFRGPAGASRRPSPARPRSARAAGSCPARSHRRGAIVSRSSTSTPPVGKSGPVTKSISAAVLGVRIVDQMRSPPRSARRHCAAGCWSPCRPRSRSRHWRADWGTGRGRPRALPPRHYRWACNRPSLRRARPSAAAASGQPRLGVAVGGGIIPVDVAEIALPVDQRVTEREILRQPDHRVIDRLVAVRMIFADDVADDARAFLVGAMPDRAAAAASPRAGGGEPASAHRGRRAATAR